MKNWYIVQSHSSFENKVAQLIREEADKAKISDKFEEIVVPTHDVTEVKRGKRVQRKKKYFPGYVLIKSEMDNSIYHMIKGIKKVSGFLGSKGIPVPVSDKEIASPSTITTVSLLPETTNSTSESSISDLVGFIMKSPPTLPTLTVAMGPFQGIEDIINAAYGIMQEINPNEFPPIF